MGARTPVTIVAGQSAEVTGPTKIRCRKETPPGSSVIQNVCEIDRSEADRQRMQLQVITAIQQGGGVHAAVGAPWRGHPGGSRVDRPWAERRRFICVLAMLN